MRSTNPHLVLQGNQRDAKKWIPWATKALDRIKNLSVEGTANKVFRPVAGVAIHVHSVNDIDRIRIAAGIKKRCSVNFTFEVTGLTVDFVGELKGSATRYFWDFGDGQFSDEISSSLSHTYYEAGTYIVTVKGYEPVVADQYDALVITLANTAKLATHDSNANAHALWDSLPWIPTAISAEAGFRVSYWDSPLGEPSDTWTYRAFETTITIPLQNIAGFDSVINGRALIWIEGLYLKYTTNWLNEPSPPYPILETVSGSDLGLSVLNLPIGLPQERIAGVIDVGVPMVESEIRVTDSGDWGILDDPKPLAGGNPKTLGWGTLDNDTGMRLRMAGYKCISVKQKSITVT